MPFMAKLFMIIYAFDQSLVLISLRINKEMYMNIYVGNLPFDISEDELSEVFTEFGAVSSTKIIQDRETGRSKGFGFIEMDNDDEAQEAIKSLNGNSVKGRDIKVNESKPREERPRRDNNRW